MVGCCSFIFSLIKGRMNIVVYVFVYSYILVDVWYFFLRVNCIKGCICIFYERMFWFDLNFWNVKIVMGSIFFYSFDNFFNVFSCVKWFIVFCIVDVKIFFKI